jgi:hypothetical protein
MFWEKGFGGKILYIRSPIIWSVEELFKTAVPLLARRRNSLRLRSLKRLLSI